ncbi:MAG: hypothetical protein PF690_17430 [Deltaproteobacteria bacterium]|jgi:hypothetical protein|nr:hypothetical protein [Deltaproteobacteria bacterium]
MKEINSENKSHVVNYIMSNLSKKHVKISEFAEACGFSITYLYMIRAMNDSKVPEKLWKYLYGIYKDNQFDAIMRGEGPKYNAIKRNPVYENGGKTVTMEPKEPASSIDEAITLLNRACKEKGVSCKVILEAV